MIKNKMTGPLCPRCDTNHFSTQPCPAASKPKLTGDRLGRRAVASVPQPATEEILNSGDEVAAPAPSVSVQSPQPPQPISAGTRNTDKSAPPGTWVDRPDIPATTNSDAVEVTVQVLVPDAPKPKPERKEYLKIKARERRAREREAKAAHELLLGQLKEKPDVQS